MSGDERFGEAPVPGASSTAQVYLGGPFHPDRNGCDCVDRGILYAGECVHPDPCWVDKDAYERSGLAHDCEACGGGATEYAFSPEDGDLWFCEPCITALREGQE